MAIPLEKRKTIFSNGVPKFTTVQTEYKSNLAKDFGGQPTPSLIPILTSKLGTTAKGVGRYDPHGLQAPPIPKTYQEIITIGKNTLVQKLNDYPYIKRRNDILQIGDSRGRGEKYPPEILLHGTGGSGYAGSGFDDGFVRGGIVQSTAIALEDIARVGNFLLSGKGLLWTLREQGLQMTNARPETRLFNPVTMLLNVGGQHLGIHLPRHGLNPFTEGQGLGILDFGYNTYSTVKDYDGELGNRFGVIPFNAVPRSTSPGGPQPKLQDMVSEMFLGDKSINLSSVSSLLNSILPSGGSNISKYAPPRDRAAGGGEAEINTISYLAAGNAPYGGFSLFGNGIHRATNTILDSQYPRDITPESPSLKSLIDNAQKLVNGASIGNAIAGLTKSALSNLASITAGIGSGKSAGATEVPTKVPVGTSFPIPNPDLLKVYKSLAYGELGLMSTMYISTDRETLAGPSQNYGIYPKLAKRVPSNRSHLITSKFTDPGNPSGVSPDATNALPRAIGENGSRLESPHDLVPLIFYDIKNDESLVFRAVLSAITDTINPEWNEYNYIGNPQTYYTYKRTTRDFGFTFKVYTDTEQELRWNWMKINRFVGMLYPSYTSYKRMVGPFLKLTVGDIVSQVAGYISGLTITVDDNTPWEINLFDNETLARLPHMVELGVTYRIVGDEPLESTTTKFYAQRKMGRESWTWDNWFGKLEKLQPAGLQTPNLKPPTQIQGVPIP